MGTNRRHLRLWVPPLVSILLSLGTARAQTPTDTTRVLRPDTTAVDSLKRRFITGMGSLMPATETAEPDTSRFLWTDPRYVGDLLRTRASCFLRELGEPGKPPQLVMGGIDGRGIAVLMDGRPLNDPVTGMYNLYYLPVEFIERVEILPGSSAFAYAPGAPAAALNIVTRQYDTNKPITKLRFMQGPYEHLLTDGLFAQNVVRGLNLMVGFQRLVTDGRYANARYDSWNVRSRLRYNISGKVNIALTDFYTRSSLGMNSGLDIDSTFLLGLNVFNNAEAVVINRQASETVSRRDVTLSLIGRLLDDTTSTTKASFYYSFAERTYRDPTAAARGLFDEVSWKILGSQLQQSLTFDPVRFLVGGQFEKRQVSPSFVFPNSTKTYSAWFARSEFLMIPGFSPGAAIRGEKLEATRALSYMGDLTVVLPPSISIRVGYSTSYRFPSFQESNWPVYFSDPNQTFSLLEQHRVLEASASVHLGKVLSLSGGASQRKIENALVLKTLGTSTRTPSAFIDVAHDLAIRQASGTASLALRPWELIGTFTFTELKERGTLKLTHPKMLVAAELRYRDRLFKEALETQIGIRFRYATGQNGVFFLASSGVFAESATRSLSGFSVTDLYGTFRIGDATIGLTWENILDRGYFTTANYPMLDRNVKIGINWVFTD